MCVEGLERIIRILGIGVEVPLHPVLELERLPNTGPASGWPVTKIA